MFARTCHVEGLTMLLQRREKLLSQKKRPTPSIHAFVPFIIRADSLKYFYECALLVSGTVSCGLYYKNFRISVTFEIRTTEYSEIYISIDTHTVAERVYKGEEKVGKESKVAERHGERESVCVQVLIETDGSNDQHPQTAWDKETHLAIIDSRHL
jgi:hypothetical protein